MKLPSLNTILIAAVLIVGTLYIRSLFTKTPPNEKIIRADMKIEQLEKQRLVDSVDLKDARDKYDSLIAVSTERFTNLQNKKQPIINVIKKVPAVVSNMDREQLRRAITDF